MGKKRWFSYSGVLLIPATLSSVSLLPSSEYLPSSKESNVDRLEVRTAREKVGVLVVHTPPGMFAVYMYTPTHACTHIHASGREEVHGREE